MCDVPSIAVFCSESIECFPGTASKFFFRLVVTIPVAPIISGIIVHFRLHIRCISIHKLLYFNFFSASFCTLLLLLLGDRGSTVVKVLCYKSEGRWFDPSWCHWNFSLTNSFRSHYGPGVDSASNRNEYQEYFLGVKAAGA